MGVKTIKTKFRIDHIVQKVDDTICIGSPYIHDLIVINSEGKIIKGLDRHMNNDDLTRYQRDLIDFGTIPLKTLFHIKDVFGPVVPVYTHDKGRIVKKFCEEFGWPNTTTDGEIMYENSHYLDRSSALVHLREDTGLGVKYAAENFWSTVRDFSRDICRRSSRLLTAMWYYLVARIMP